MNARQLFEWAVRAQVKFEFEAEGYGSVDANEIMLVKVTAEALAFMDPSALPPEMMEKMMVYLLPKKANIEAVAAEAVAVTEGNGAVYNLIGRFGEDPLSGFPKLR